MYSKRHVRRLKKEMRDKYAAKLNRAVSCSETATVEGREIETVEGREIETVESREIGEEIEVTGNDIEMINVASENQVSLTNCHCAGLVTAAVERLEASVNAAVERLEASVERLEGTMTALLTEMRTLRAQQNTCAVLVEAVAEQAGSLKSLVRQQGPGQTVAKCFPVLTVQGLIELDMEINSTNRALYIDAIRHILLPSGISKNLKNVLANAVVMAYNVDGVQGKSSLKNLKNFYGVLIDAIAVETGTGSAEVQLRKALQLQKKRCFKNSNTANNNKKN